ncbi:cytochrome P450 [Viridothelium virens]|uniref:Cytochrome P450 n=1 Tax=Viridothelium virens TaxID=1048519 RepID=A0A6A6HCD3_VIRVR|nr:cytochrome P450 [Viridothelium virens]
MMLLVLVLGISVFWAGWTGVCLASNYAQAQKLGFPIVVLPISTMNILWIIVQPAVIALIERLHGTSHFTRFGGRDWHFREKARHHLEFGDAWLLVTPGQVWFQVADPDAIIDIFQRRTHFTRPIELYQLLNVFGHNAATVGWVDWKRHRKVIAAPFNEGTNHLVWTESLKQASDMIRDWKQTRASGKLGLQKDTRTLALNVLAATGFGRSYKFHASGRPHDDEIGSYREALSIIMDNALFMMLVPPKILCSRLVPKSWQKIGHATHSFKRYMMDLLEQEKRLVSEGKAGANHLTAGLLRALEIHSNPKPNGTEIRGDPVVRGLTVNELLGNIFLINFAGHDTTANTLAFAILHLAANLHVQNWVAEEVRGVLGEKPSEDWEYESVFPRLKRPLAVMYETVRLFPPIMALPKYTSGGSQDLTIGGSTVTVSSGIYVVPSLLAIHTHPRHWGDDALEWKPSRWIDADGEFLVPARGTYFPWSEGAQNCPGRKFSQVEFVAVVASLFQSLLVRPVLAEGESMEQARKRLLEIAEKSSHGVLLRMKNADDVRLSWVLAE